ncbi:ribosome assembly factor SBDS [Candidatus Pacearchaeota archaeon]|nr:ribosome assembly factor SBDS [Candidatus Pacearchaeota archaeon]
MPKVVARIKIKNKHYEIQVDLDEALKVKAGKGNIMAAVDAPRVYYDMKKGNLASASDLMDAFGTQDFYEIAKKIIASGEVQKTQEFRDAEHEALIKQVIHLLLKNAIDQHGRPYTEDRLRRAIDEVHFNFDTKPAEQQMNLLLPKLQEVIPIRIETKKVKLIIPARFTGQVYGMLKDYKESEEWRPNGDLQVIMNIPSGLQIDFYDKLNSITHGAVQSQEMPQA